MSQRACTLIGGGDRGGDFGGDCGGGGGCGARTRVKDNLAI